jgi:hypothetical protein
MQNCFHRGRINDEQSQGTMNFLCPDCEAWVMLSPDGRIDCYDDTTFELCPLCGRETPIPVTGGYCIHCGLWVRPCSMCDCCSYGNGDPCPFEAINPR